MNISIFGLGYTGCVGIGCLAEMGHQMVGVDLQPAKVELIGRGCPTIIEKDIAGILAKQHALGRVSATVDGAEAIGSTTVSLICVGTPSTPNGHLDLTAIYKVAEQIGEALKHTAKHHVIAVRSTVLPGTTEAIAGVIARVSGRVANRDFAVVSNPEFLREGSSVDDFRNPPYTLVGSTCEWAIGTMREVYSGTQALFVSTSPEVAELAKYVSNSFHALKITFANEVGNICAKLGVDAQKLMDVFCQDTHLNISRAYLKPGFAYGGSCLPKDVKALQTIAHDYYVETPVLQGIERSNQLQKELALDEILAFEKQNVGFVGLAFKAGTDDLRESPIVDVIERLLGKGFHVKIYDPNVHLSQLTGANRDYILRKIPYISGFITDDLNEVMRASELIVIVNEQAGLGDAITRAPGGRIIYDLSRRSHFPAGGPRRV